MALFARKKTPSFAPDSAKATSGKKATEGKEEKKVAIKPVATDALALRSEGETRDVAQVLKHARITEKATMHGGAGVYTFDISGDATKRDVIAAVRALYKVTPRKVAVVMVPSKVRRNVRTGKTGLKRGGKKAYVYLKKGETINMS